MKSPKPPPAINISQSPDKLTHTHSNDHSHVSNNETAASYSTAPPRTPTASRAGAGGLLSPLSARYPPIHEDDNAGGGNDQTPGTVMVPSTPNGHNPFNFTSVAYSPGLIGPAPHTAKGDLGRRRGHKYARSSVSHELIASPPPRTPLQLPVSLPMPTFAEYRASMTREQRTRAIWCAAHLLIAGYVQTQAHEALSVTALSHLLFYDALSAILCVAVDVFRNFEVWSRATVSHAFGLARLEVLAGLAMSITLLFMGLDLLSHGTSHALQTSGGHAPHHHGAHSHHGLDSVNVAAALALFATVASAVLLGNHSRIGRAVRMPLLEALPAGLRNPGHVLPISLAVCLLFLPRLGIRMSGRIDAMLGFAYAAGMVLLGARLCYGIGRMLLMSFSSTTSDADVGAVAHEISKDSLVVAVDDAKVWQVHYGVCIASFKVRVHSVQGAERLRERIVALVENRLGGGYGEGSRGVRWEVSTQIRLQ